MSDALPQDDRLAMEDELTPTQEYLIAGAVILFFGLLYWYLNRAEDTDLAPPTTVYEHVDAGLGSTVAGTGTAEQGGGVIADKEQAHESAQLSISHANTQQEPLKATAGAADDRETSSKSAMPEAAAVGTVKEAQTPAPLPTVTWREPQAAEIEALSQAEIERLQQLKAEEARLEAETVKLQAEAEAARNQALADVSRHNKGIAAFEAKDHPPVVADEPEVAHIVAILPDGTPVEIAESGVEGELKKVMSAPAINAPVNFDNIYFNSGSTEILAESGRLIRVVAALMHLYPERRILLRGHSDNTGNAASNKQLSLMRANAVALAIGRLGINTNRIRILGAGQDYPLVSNATEAGRKKNRRIELFVTQ